MKDRLEVGQFTATERCERRRATRRGPVEAAPAEATAAERLPDVEESSARSRENAAAPIPPLGVSVSDYISIERGPACTPAVYASQIALPDVASRGMSLSVSLCFNAYSNV